MPKNDMPAFFLIVFAITLVLCPIFYFVSYYSIQNAKSAFFDFTSSRDAYLRGAIDQSDPIYNQSIGLREEHGSVMKHEHNGTGVAVPTGGARFEDFRNPMTANDRELERVTRRRREISNVTPSYFNLDGSASFTTKLKWDAVLASISEDKKDPVGNLYYVENTEAGKESIIKIVKFLTKEKVSSTLATVTAFAVPISLIATIVFMMLPQISATKASGPI